DYVCATVSGIDRRRLRGGGSTLATHILYNSIPVLTEAGRGIKDDFSLPAPQNWVLQLVDDYASIESIVRSLEAKNQIPLDETLRMLQELESQRFIFPLFARIQFLSNCYHNRKRFRLGRYMVAAGIINESQLQELLEQQQEEGFGKSQKSYLGLLAVRAGYINTRELETLLDDQFLYGGLGADRGKGQKSDARPINADTMRDSMIGSLGAIDTAGLLQSLATAKKTGLLTVENRENTLAMSFVDGKPTHALMNNLRGFDAVAEFLVSWRDGIFVFKDKASMPELNEEDCQLSVSLDRMLLDSALYQDQLNQILKKLPSAQNTVLERVWNFDALWHQLLAQHPYPNLRYLDESPVSETDRQDIVNLVHCIDGLSTIEEVSTVFDRWPRYKVLRAIDLLLENNLVNVQKASLFRPLTVFQKITFEIQEIVGKEDNRAMLEASLHYVHGDSPAASRFHVD
ncbi:MAG TPA: DUF4388 domain-containing protein, partial [Candidatus Melainabacteria bacterium]|nr:DUF4388 domain-containing protein [Candidatus Melainabacteria bacterium]